jgi:hypothetical protein
MTDTTSTEGLKACPFCGAEVTVIESLARAFSPPIPFREYHHTQGGQCFIRQLILWSGEADSDEEAAFIALWNTRTEAQPTQSAGTVADALERFEEDWFDCGNMGWCHAEGRCTRHNPDEYRAARHAALSSIPHSTAPANDPHLDRMARRIGAEWVARPDDGHSTEVHSVVPRLCERCLLPLLECCCPEVHSDSKLADALEAALCAPTWAQSLGHVHDAVAALGAEAPQRPDEEGSDA